MSAGQVSPSTATSDVATTSNPRAAQHLRASQHAAHYLSEGVQTAALQATLTHTARLLDFPIGAVSIANNTSLHTLAFTGDIEVPVFSRVNTPCDRVIDSARAVSIADLFSRESPFGDPYHRIVSRTESRTESRTGPGTESRTGARTGSMDGDPESSARG